MNHGMPAKLGDVVQHGMDTRFIQSGLVLRYGGQCVAAIWFCGDEHAAEILVCRPPPDDSIDWLRLVPTELPTQAPTRLAIDSCLLDRTATMYVDVEACAVDGTPAPACSESAQFALYASPSGTVACVLAWSEGSSRVWHGPRLEAFDYDNLGRGIAEP
jgi:hypothetical protein